MHETSMADAEYPRSRDLIDRYPRYVTGRDMSPWETTVWAFLQEFVLPLALPEEGCVLELGTARGINFSRLADHYGLERCVGFDVANYGNHPRVREIDVRTLGREDDFPLALAWNDLSDWEQSPRSKAAGLKFAARNLVPGGYYMDACLTESARRWIRRLPASLVVERDSIALFDCAESSVLGGDSHE